VANLGRLSEEATEAVRMALKVAKTGESVVLASEAAAALQGTTVANLRYLDIAVLLHCWKQWGLSSEIDALAVEFVDWDPEVSLADTVFPLVAQRCCAPASKLGATRWVPTTALPELIGFELSAFNNSRVHRALTGLYTVTDRLQDRLPQLFQERDGVFAAMFMDTTDTHFEGMGCPMAEQTRTKSEIPNKRCLSIVLLANEHGYPLRWKVLGGKTKDWTAMSDTIEELGDVPWLRNTPIVFDRAMGQPSTVAKLKATGLHFITAAHVTSIESYTGDLPHTAFANVQLEGTDEAYERDIERVAQAARDAGFDEINPRLFAIDLGVAIPAKEAEARSNDADAPRRRRGLPGQILRARRIREQLDADPELTRAKVAASLGIGESRVTQILGLLRLAPPVQERILELGASCPVNEPQTRPWRRLSPEQQLAKLEEHEPKAVKSDSAEPVIGPLRMVAYFNPRLFVDIRRRGQCHCELLQAHVDAINAELAAAKKSRKEAPTYRKFSREVERLRYLDLFDIELDETEVTSAHGKALRSYRGAITRRDDAWARRRRYDGFVLLLAHPKLERTASEIVAAYRGKDVVEKDFQTIKDVEKLRPVYHYTDAKVQAHVSVCMLALLLQRTLRRRLKQAGLDDTAPAALDLLSTCHLNQRPPLAGVATYDITQLNAAQRRILAACGLENLATGGYAASKLRPRAIAR
ncbi:MAG: hypothetical protein GY719_12780, partial [bacterium]|nr:hypothetical protein [bacterium]